MASLVGQQLKDTYDSLLKTSDNDALGGTYKEITDGSGNGSNLYLGTSGSVGIGTSSIDGTLHLDAGTSSDLVIEKDDGGYASVRFHNAGSQVSYIQLDASEDMIYYGGSGVNQIIYAGGSERLRIDSIGTIKGIGTYTAGNSIKIFEAERLGGAVASDWSYDDANTDMSLGTSTAHSFSLKTSDTRALTIDSSQNANFAGKVVVGKDSSNALEVFSSGDTEIGFSYATQGNIYAKIIGDITHASPLGGELAFQTATGGTLTERMRIDSSGNTSIYSGVLNLGTDSVASSLNCIGDVFNIGVDSDGNTGGSPSIRFNVSGSEKMRIDSSGNVGINGTPSDKLEVAGLSNYTGLTLKGNAASRPALTFKNVNQSLLGSIYGTENRSLTFESGGNGTTGVVAMNIDSSGIVQARRARSNTAGNVALSLQPSDSTIHYGFRIDSANNFLNIDRVEPSGTIMTLDPSGNVGIGGTPASISGDASWLTLNADDGSSASGGVIYQVNGTTKGATYTFGSNVYHDAKSGIGHQFAVNNGSTAMTIDTSGRVGIGDIPKTQHSNVTDSLNVGSHLTFQRTKDTYIASNFYYNSSDVGKSIASGWSPIYQQDVVNGKHIWYNATASATGADETVSVNPLMTIDSSGNVGIGNTDPDHPLTVTAGPSSAGVPVAWIHNSTNSADHDGTVISSTNDGADAEVLHVRANNTTYNNGTSLMLVRGDGNVLVGTTSTDVYLNNTANDGGISMMKSAQGFRLDVARDGNCYTANRPSTTGNVFDFRQAGVNVGAISITSSATAYNTSSDYRLKENVVEMTNALDRVDQLKPSRFNFIADADTTVDGFLAHEVADVVPEAISGEKDATEQYEVTPAVLDDEGNVVEEAVMGTRPVYQGIDQSKLVPLLVGAIQELRAEIEQLKNQ